MEFPGCVQVIGVVAFMDADGLLLPVRTKQGLKTGVPLLRLGDAAVTIILAERVISHGYMYKRFAFFCQMEKTAVSAQRSAPAERAGIGSLDTR